MSKQAVQQLGFSLLDPVCLPLRIPYRVGGCSALNVDPNLKCFQVVQVCNSLHCYTEDHTKMLSESVTLPDEDVLLLNMAYFLSPYQQKNVSTPTK